MFSLSNIGFKKGYNYILKDINWQINENENWIVFGLNGSGKTTLLNILAGYLKPTSGNIEMCGENYSNEMIMNIRKKIGLVSASYFDKCYFKENVIEIVLSGLHATLGMRENITENDVNMAKKLLLALGVKKKARYPFDLLSKGERQRVLIARALIAQPQVLILDEPTTGLDILSREYLMETIRVLAKEKKVTIIMATHYPEEILDIFTKTILLKNSRIVYNGGIEGLLDSEKVSKFLGCEVKVIQEYDKINYKMAVKPELNFL